MDLASFIQSAALQSAHTTDPTQCLSAFLNYQAAAHNLTFAPSAADDRLQKLLSIAAASTRCPDALPATPALTARIPQSTPPKPPRADGKTSEAKSRTKKAKSPTLVSDGIVNTSPTPTTRRDGKVRTTYSCPHCNYTTLMSQHMKSHLVSTD